MCKKCLSSPRLQPCGEEGPPDIDIYKTVVIERSEDQKVVGALCPRDGLLHLLVHDLGEDLQCFRT